MEHKRLTDKDYRALLVGTKVKYLDNVEMKEALNAGIDLLDARYEGRLIELPCKAGDTVWLLLEYIGNEKNEIVESKVIRFLQTKRGIVNMSCWIDAPLIGNTLEFNISDFGKTVFLAKEAAEEALEKRGDTP